MTQEKLVKYAMFYCLRKHDECIQEAKFAKNSVVSELKKEKAAKYLAEASELRKTLHEIRKANK